MPPNFTTTTRSGIHVPTSANDGTNLIAGLLQMANEMDNSNLVRSFGKSIVATTETRASAAYGLLATPDKVSVRLEADGLINVGYQAMWKESVSGAATAAIFIGTDRLRARNLTFTSVQDAQTASIGVVNFYNPLFAFVAGLRSNNGATPLAGDHDPDVTTGQIVGGAAAGSGAWYAGVCTIFAAAGTYDVSVQFAAASGSVTAKNRKLWVWSTF
jgi:hypothetical protein